MNEKFLNENRRKELEISATRESFLPEHEELDEPVEVKSPLSAADFAPENKPGEIDDFSQANDYHQLVEMIMREGSITNQLGQELPAETVINLIYKLTYQDLKNYQKADWTNITLRHNLRATVAKLIDEYKKTDEFKALAGLDLSAASTIEEVIDLINQPEKVIEINRRASQEYMALKEQTPKASPPPKSFLGRIGGAVAKLKFWKK